MVYILDRYLTFDIVDRYLMVYTHDNVLGIQPAEVVPGPTTGALKVAWEVQYQQLSLILILYY